MEGWRGGGMEGRREGGREGEKEGGGGEEGRREGEEEGSSGGGKEGRREGGRERGLTCKFFKVVWQASNTSSLACSVFLRGDDEGGGKMIEVKEGRGMARSWGKGRERERELCSGFGQLVSADHIHYRIDNITYHSLEVMKRSSLLHTPSLKHFCKASPISASLR